VPLRAGEVTLHDGLTLIEVTNEIELTTLLADPRLANLIVTRLGPTAAVVLPHALGRLLQAMPAAGHTPIVLDAP
jgi:hypothetical protein